MEKIIFRVDGGAIYSIATGHITRCLKLANYIKNKNNSTDIIFIMKNYEEGVALVKDKFQVVLLDKNIDFKSEIIELKKILTSKSIFICDLRNINNDYIVELKKNIKKFILFDDLARQDLFPDILINPTPFCYEKYDKSNFPKTELLLGEEFFFVNEYLYNNRYQRNFDKEIFNIMASFGGADPCNITEFFLKEIVPKINEHKISVILGPAYKKKEYIIEKYSDLKNVEFYTNIFPLDDMFLKNDIAFVCGGDTCIEAMVSGCFTFIISSIYYEKEFAEHLHKKKLAYHLTDIEEIKRSKNIDFKLKYFLKQIDNKNRFVDNKGLLKVYSKIKNR